MALNLAFYNQSFGSLDPLAGVEERWNSCMYSSHVQIDMEESGGAIQFQWINSDGYDFSIGTTRTMAHGLDGLMSSFMLTLAGVQLAHGL